MYQCTPLPALIIHLGYTRLYSIIQHYTPDHARIIQHYTALYTEGKLELYSIIQHYTAQLYSIIQGVYIQHVVHYTALYSYIHYPQYMIDTYNILSVGY